MAKIITGIVSRDSIPYESAKVFVSDYQGKITPKKIGTLTDSQGKYTLDIEGQDGGYISASTTLGDFATSMLKNEVSEYNLDFAVGKINNQAEVVVSREKPKENVPAKIVDEKPKINESPAKKRDWFLITFIGLGVLVLGVSTYLYLKKNK